MENPAVTIVVVPRERFSGAQRSLESLFEHTKIPFKLIYIDGGSPHYLKKYLHQKAREKNFQLIRTNHYLNPTKARIMGLNLADTKYTVLCDNDIIVTPDWLKHMVNCAEETRADIVSPLIIEGETKDNLIHSAGGSAKVQERVKNGVTIRDLIDIQYFHQKPLAEVKDKLKREPTTLAEHHCVLLRTQYFKDHNILDPRMINTKEHIDYCMTVQKLGGIIYFEPKSYVVYPTMTIFKSSDILYYMLRWSDAWEEATLSYFIKKWNITEESYKKKRWGMIGYRRRKYILRPLCDKIPSWKLSSLAYAIWVPLDKVFNRILSVIYSLSAPRLY